MMPGNAEYSEIITYLRGRFRPLTGPDDQPCAHLNTLDADISREELLAASTLPETVNRFLVQLDTKLDAILAVLQSSSLERDFPHTLEVVSLSAAAVRFTSDLPLAKGDQLEVILKFRETGTSTVAGIGTVTDRIVDNNGVPLFVFTFTRIREEEREKIIRHVFTEERRLLRESRLA
jgi:PilZ domain.